MSQSADAVNSAVADLALREVITTFRTQKKLAERAIAQLDDAALHRSLHAETNSIAIIMKHMAGNMISRWTDFLTSDGEKPGRQRDSEFIDDFTTRQSVIDHWERGWKTLFDTLESLTPNDLTKTVTIRGEPHSVIRALLRQIDHYGYHVGQIVLVARILAGPDWTTLSIPRGGSDEYNQRTWKR